MQDVEPAGQYNPEQNAVLNAIKSSNDDESGISVNDILAQLQGKYKEEKVREVIDWLSSEGHVYSTIDDDHFKSTDS